MCIARTTGTDCDWNPNTLQRKQKHRSWLNSSWTLVCCHIGKLNISSRSAIPTLCVGSTLAANIILRLLLNRTRRSSRSFPAKAQWFPFTCSSSHTADFNGACLDFAVEPADHKSQKIRVCLSVTYTMKFQYLDLFLFFAIIFDGGTFICLAYCFVRRFSFVFISLDALLWFTSSFLCILPNISTS